LYCPAVEEFCRWQRFKSNIASPQHPHTPGFSFNGLPATNVGVYRGASYEEWIKETRLDIRTGSRTEDDGAQENSGAANSQEAEAN
jgi:hypothetical protein